MATTEQSTYRATNDAYTGMLAISLCAMIAGSVLLFLDYQQYPEGAPPKLPKEATKLPKVEPQKAGEAKEEPKAEEKKE
jgi:hypothetical protein